MFTQELLFGSDGSSAIVSTSRAHAAQCDYYTISGAGFTFHQQCDAFRASFLSTFDWERQKQQFERITRLPTFQLYGTCTVTTLRMCVVRSPDASTYLYCVGGTDSGTAKCS